MGNIYSEYQICDCNSTHTVDTFVRATRSGSKTETELGAEVQVIEKKDRRARVRTLSMGDGDATKSEVMRSCASHTYLLRSRNKAEECRIAPKVSKKANSKVVKPEVDQSTDHEFRLSSMLEGLSLANITNTVDVPNNNNDKGPQLKVTKLSTNCQLMGEEEDVELPKHVLYYGWFFSTETSSVIHAVVMHYFRLCYSEVPQFQRFMLTCCKDADIRDPFEYYKPPRKRKKPDDLIKYHVTAKFLGRDPDPLYQTLVHPFLQKIFRLHLVGLVFTPRTFGVRVKPTPAQQLIFDEKDELKNGRRLSEQSSKISDIRKQIQEEIDGYNVLYKRHRKNHPNCKMKTVPNSTEEDGISFKRIHQDPTTAMTTQSRAHITIGCAPKVVAKQTGDDLVDVIDLEQRQATSGNSNFQQDFKIEGGILRQFGKHANAFVFYPDTEMIVPCQYNLFI